MALSLPPALTELMREYSGVDLRSALLQLRDALLDEHGEAVQAMLFYGSCLRSGDDFDGLVDLYVLVDDYRHFYAKPLPALFNRLLPPNVYYREVEVEGRVLRAKVAVLSLGDFERGTSPAWFHSYLWGRFSQPSALVYSRDAETEERVVHALAQAVVTFVTRVLPRLPGRFTVDALWQVGLQASYHCELRSEGPQRAAELVEAGVDYYRAITGPALTALPWQVRPGGERGVYVAQIPARVRRSSGFTWWLRRVQGKVLSLLRLMKALFTFNGGLDYILWKIERHSGITVEVSPLARRWPLIAGWGVFWRLYRQGAFR